MASVVHLVRHGEVENPRNVVYADLPGFHLSRRGRREAAWTGAFLADRPIEAVYASPLDRAMETASIIASRHGLKPNAVESLGEWRLMNRWSGLLWQELDTHFPGELETYLSDPTGMDFAPESLHDLAQRLARTLTELAGRTPDGEIVVVSHQDPIQAARLVLTGQPLLDLHLVKPHHCETISLVPGCPWSENGRLVPDV